MNDQDAKAFVAGLDKMNPKQRSAAWAKLTPEDCVVAWTAMTPHEREADVGALNEAWIEEDGISYNNKQRRREIVQRNKELIRKGLLVDYGRRDGMAVLVATKYLTDDGLFTGYEPNSLKSKKIYTHDFHGNEPEGYCWTWAEESFEHSATDFRVDGNDRAAAIADQLVATTDNVPTEIMSEHQEFWNQCGDLEADMDYALSKLVAIDEQMLEEIGRGEFTPGDATAFVLEFIRRASGIRGS